MLSWDQLQYFKPFLKEEEWWMNFHSQQCKCFWSFPRTFLYLTLWSPPKVNLKTLNLVRNNTKTYQLLFFPNLCLYLLQHFCLQLDIKTFKINFTYVFNLILEQGCKSLFTLLNSDPYPTSIKKSHKKENHFFELEQLAKAGDLNCCVIQYLSGAGGRIYLGELSHMCIVWAKAMIRVFQ